MTTFQNNGKLKLLIIVGTRPEIIRLAAVINECLPEETNRRIVDIISDVNMAYSEHARRYLADTGLPKERTYVTGSPMAEPTHERVQYQAAA